MFKSISKNLVSAVTKRGFATGDFLSQGEQQQLLPYLNALQKEAGHFTFAFVGYVHGSDRKKPVLLSKDYEGVEYRDFSEITPLYLEVKGEKPTHSEVLGSILGLGIERSAVGDIFPYENGVVVLLKDSIAPYVLKDLAKIGRNPVTLREIELPQDFEIERQFEELKIDVASLRLDSVLARLLKKSREEASDYIREGAASVNFKEERRNDLRLQEGDILSLRHYGRFKVGESVETRKSGRLHLTVYRYK